MVVVGIFVISGGCGSGGGGGGVPHTSPSPFPDWKIGHAQNIPFHSIIIFIIGIHSETFTFPFNQIQINSVPET